jgi:hypothetical protein
MQPAVDAPEVAWPAAEAVPVTAPLYPPEPGGDFLPRLSPVPVCERCATRS